MNRKGIRMTVLTVLTVQAVLRVPVKQAELMVQAVPTELMALRASLMTEQIKAMVIPKKISHNNKNKNK